jgi:hypothetical protein
MKNEAASRPIAGRAMGIESGGSAGWTSVPAENRRGCAREGRDRESRKTRKSLKRGM